MSQPFDTPATPGPGGGAPPGPVILTNSCSGSTVLDGDTLFVTLSSPWSWKNPVVRLRGVDAPELGGPQAQRAAAAQAFVSTYCLNKNCTIRAYGQDKYGRVVADVHAPALGNVGPALVAAGLASTYPGYIRPPYFDKVRSAPPWVIRSGKVTQVFDGDTVRVTFSQGLQYTRPCIRLARVQCAELDGHQRGLASAALQFVAAAVASGTLTLRTYGVDMYGRAVSDIILPGGAQLGSQLVGAGLAAWFPLDPGFDPFPGEDGRWLLA